MERVGGVEENVVLFLVCCSTVFEGSRPTGKPTCEEGGEIEISRAFAYFEGADMYS